MASRGNPAEPRRPAPRLYLVTPQHPEGLEVALAQSLSAADVAAVLLRLPPANERLRIDFAKALAPAVQNQGVALLLDGEPDLAAPAGADGAHLTGLAALEAGLRDAQTCANCRLRRACEPA